MQAAGVEAHRYMVANAGVFPCHRAQCSDQVVCQRCTGQHAAQLHAWGRELQVQQLPDALHPNLDKAARLCEALLDETYQILQALHQRGDQA